MERIGVSPPKLRILLLEDSPADAELITIALVASLDATFERVDDKESFLNALSSFEPDVVVSDHSLGQFDARAALRAVSAIRPATPVIIATGAADEQAKVDFVR